MADAAPSLPVTDRPSGIARALRHRNFQLFFGGQLLSLTGTWMQSVAQSWLVYRITGSAILLGTVGFSGQIPVFFLAPIGGALADRHRRRRIIVITQTTAMILAFILAALTLTGRVRVWHIMTLSALMGVVNAFDIPARQAFLVEMVGREDLMNAIALNSSMFNGARLIGPAVAGILVAGIGEGWCFFTNGVSYLAVIAGLLMMRLGPWSPPERTASTLENVLEGMSYVRRTAPIRALLLLVGLVSLVAMPYTVLMPVFADTILQSGARGLGVLMGATGMGALLGALFVASRRGLRGLGKVTAAAAAGFGVSLILFAISRRFWLSAAMLVPIGFCMMLQMACTNTLIQSMVPERLRGRVMAVYSMMFMGMAPIGALLAGVAAGHIGAPLTVSIGAVGALLGAGVFARHLPGLRPEATRLILAQGMIGGEPAEEMTTHGIIADE